MGEINIFCICQNFLSCQVTHFACLLDSCGFLAGPVVLCSYLVVCTPFIRLSLRLIKS